MIQKGNRIIVTQGEIFCTNQNRIVATAIGTFNAYPGEGDFPAEFKVNLVVELYSK